MRELTLSPIAFEAVISERKRSIVVYDMGGIRLMDGFVLVKEGEPPEHCIAKVLWVDTIQDGARPAYIVSIEVLCSTSRRPAIFVENPRGGNEDGDE